LAQLRLRLRRFVREATSADDMCSSKVDERKVVAEEGPPLARVVSKRNLEMGILCPSSSLRQLDWASDIEPLAHLVTPSRGRRTPRSAARPAVVVPRGFLRCILLFRGLYSTATHVSVTTPLAGCPWQSCAG